MDFSHLCRIRQSSDQVQSTDRIDSEHQNAERSLLGVQSLKVVENLLHLRFLGDNCVSVDVHRFGVFLLDVIRMASLALDQNEFGSGRKLKALIEVLAF